MARDPHYVRVARALALLTGLAGVPACASSTTLTTDARVVDDGGRLVIDGGYEDSGPAVDSATTDTDSGVVVADAGAAPDAWIDDCSTCTCGVAGDLPDCNLDPATVHCCIAIGPLSPPDLPAWA